MGVTWVIGALWNFALPPNRDIIGLCPMSPYQLKQKSAYKTKQMY